MLKVKILTDDRVCRRGLLAEHGLSIWIEKDGKSVLFDTGQTSVYCHNAGVMEVDIGKADHIVLSHGHYDHCGGLEHFPFGDKVPSIHAHPEAFLRKLALDGKNKTYREIGIHWEASMKAVLERLIIYNRQPLLIEEGMMLSGEIPVSDSFSEVIGNFFTEKKGRIVKDMMLDEQMLIVEDEGEIAVFLGCSHPGVVSSLNYAQRLFPEKGIKLIVAGMHLGQVDHSRIRKIAQYLKDIKARMVVPLHCTGISAMCLMDNMLEDNCRLCTAGDMIEI